MTDSIDLLNVLGKLKAERKIFHSEADFQHSLAWKIHENHPKFRVRLEQRFSVKDENSVKDEDFHVDIVVHTPEGNLILIEVKYKTKKFDYEEYHLREHSAPDTSRYDFCNDIRRIERILKDKSGSGFAILLTNDSAYWEKGRKDDPNDKMFRLHRDTTLGGKLRWKNPTAPSVPIKSQKEIPLIGIYPLKWENYLGKDDVGSEFKYLAVKVLGK